MIGFSPFRFDLLAHPWALVLLAGVALLFLFECLASPPAGINISTGDILSRLRTRRGETLRRLPALLRALGLSLLVVALAGPLNGFQVRKDRANVIDIMLCVDVSSSMSQEDFFAAGQYQNRLYVTKEAAQDFIKTRKDTNTDRYGMDRIGLITYAGFAWTQCPLTLDYDILERELTLSQIVTDRRKDGTAIGSAIGLALRRLSQSEAKSKVIILLTDGLNNRGELDPMTAAQMAKRYGIKIYTIGAGSTEQGLIPSGGLFPVRSQPIDEEMLKRIAATTDGKYYRTTDTESLHQAYAEISQLETTEIDVGDFYQYNDAFMPYLLMGAAFVLASLALRRHWYEAIP